MSELPISLRHRHGEHSRHSMQQHRRLKNSLGSTAAEVDWWWPSEVRSSIDFKRTVHVPLRSVGRLTASTPTTDAATEREHSTRRRRLSRLNCDPRSHQSRIVALDALVAFPADHPSRCNLFPLPQHHRRVCPGYHSSTKEKSASERSPSFRLFDACSLASCYHQIPMVPQVPQGLGPTYPRLSIRIRFTE